MTSFLGIDIGTTALKAALFDPHGHLLAMDCQEYELATPSPAIVELDPDVYWYALCRTIKAVLAKTGDDPRSVTALAFSCQGETLIPVDSSGAPLRRAIVWLDNRAGEEAAWLENAFDVEDTYRTTGQPGVMPAWPACKILWMRRHEPAVFARTARFLLLEDYLLYRLTGRFATEYCLQSSSLSLDIQKRAWWPEMLAAIGISRDQLGELLSPGAVVGTLSAAGAAATGLSATTIVVSGGLDQIVGALGAGNVTPGVVSEMTGGALAVVATTRGPHFDPQRRVPCHCHVVPGAYCLLPWAQTAGMALRWFRDRFFPLEMASSLAAGLDPYDAIIQDAAQVAAGSDGLLVLPHLEGAACPEFNPSARAVFFGATLRHTRAHFVRAIMEAVAFMLKRHVAIVEELGVSVHEVRSIGGGARSPLWLQIKADVLQKPVLTIDAEEVACLGAAILAAAATGFYDSLEQGVSGMVRLHGRIEPRQEHAGVYDRRYAEYLELYARLAPMFR